MKLNAHTFLYVTSAYSNFDIRQFKNSMSISLSMNFQIFMNSRMKIVGKKKKFESFKLLILTGDFKIELYRNVILIKLYKNWKRHFQK